MIGKILHCQRQAGRGTCFKTQQCGKLPEVVMRRSEGGTVKGTLGGS